MIWDNVMRFIDRLIGNGQNVDSIPPWKEDLTPDHERRELATKTKLGKHLVTKMRLELKTITEEHKPLR